MAKRIVYQCDRCSKTIEQELMPGDWVEISATNRPQYTTEFTYKKIWCEGCWKAVSTALPLAKREIKEE